jgi:hypothetical protein
MDGQHSQHLAGFYFGENILTNFLFLLVFWVIGWLYFLIGIPLVLFVGMLNGLCEGIQNIDKFLQESFPSFILFFILILFLLFPFFMIPLFCFLLYKRNKKITWHDFI